MESRPNRTPTISSAAVTGTHALPVTSSIEQILWLLLVFFLVHNALKFMRVGPILGFFGATGPEAIGYWSALEVIADFLFFRLF